MKKTAVCLICLLLLVCGCGQKNNGENTVKEYRLPDAALFPLFGLDEQNILWRIEADGAFPIRQGEAEQFVYLPQADRAYFLQTQNGVTDLYCQTGDRQAERLVSDVRKESFCTEPSGNALVLTRSDELVVFDGTLCTAAQGVAEAVFAGTDTVLYRSNEGKTEDNVLSYPVYELRQGQANFLTDAQALGGSDGTQTFLLTRTYTVSKRSATVQVADISVYRNGQIRYSVPAVLLDRAFTCAPYVLSCRENESTLLYDVYELQEEQAQPVCYKALALTALASDVYACEVFGNNGASVRVLTDGMRIDLPAEAGVSLRNLVWAGQTLYGLENGKLWRWSMTEGKKPLAEKVSCTAVCGQELAAFCGKEGVFTCLLFSDGQNVLEVKNLSRTQVAVTDRALYYFSGSDCDLMRKTRTGSVDAVVSNVDDSPGIRVADGCLAVVRRDATLYLYTGSDMADTGITIRRFL